MTVLCFTATCARCSILQSDTFDPTAYKIKKQTGPAVTFYDPSNPTSAGTKSDVYLYNFYPKLPNVFRQQGTQTTPRIYWLAVGLSGGAAGKSFGWQGADAPGDGARVRQVPGVWDPLTDPDGQVTDRAYFCPPAPSLPGKQPLPGLPSVLGWKFTETRCLDRSVSLWCAGAFGRYVELGASGGWVARCPFCGGQNFATPWLVPGPHPGPPTHPPGGCP